MFQVRTINDEDLELYNKPNSCPYCHSKIIPRIISGYLTEKNNIADVFMLCPNEKCNKTFICNYYSSPHSYKSFQLNGIAPMFSLKEKYFSESIINISVSFENIYNQAYQAEQMRLTEICGVGYRKALEFLIKDYLITLYPEKEDLIKNKMLGSCINEFVTNIQIKKVAERAVWIGNDETHYTRKWENKGIEDLKKLIDLSVHWIEMEVLTASFEIEMPKPSK